MVLLKMAKHQTMWKVTKMLRRQLLTEGLSGSRNTALLRQKLEVAVWLAIHQSKNLLETRNYLLVCAYSMKHLVRIFKLLRLLYWSSYIGVFS